MAAACRLPPGEPESPDACSTVYSGGSNHSASARNLVAISLVRNNVFTKNDRASISWPPYEQFERELSGDVDGGPGSVWRTDAVRLRPSCDIAAQSSLLEQKRDPALTLTAWDATQSIVIVRSL